MQFIGARFLQCKSGELRSGRIGAGGQGKRRLILGQEARGTNRLVQLQREGNRRTLDRRHAPGVFDAFLRERGVIRIADRRIGFLQPGMLEDLDLEFIRTAAAVFHVISQIARHFGNRRAKHGIIERALKRNAFRRSFPGLNHQHRFVGNGAAETRHHDKRAALFEFHASR